MLLTSLLGWTLAFFLGISGIRQLKPLGIKLKNHFLQTKEVESLRRSVRHLKLLSEMLESGVVPLQEDWQELRSFSEPWGSLFSESLQELRSQGAPVLPTLARMQRTLEEQAELISEGKVKSAQSFGQAFLGLILVPVFSAVLYFMMPGMQASEREFFALAAFSMFLASLSFVWMVSLVDRARFGDLRDERRPWIANVNVSMERLMALISTGLPADLAYQKTIEEMATLAPTLAREWKPQVWDSAFTSETRPENETERLILGLGTEVRRAIQTSLMEGRGCLDRLESIHRTFLLDLRMRIGRELGLLPNRCLKPLFVLVFPSVMLLLMGSMALCFQGFL